MTTNPFRLTFCACALAAAALTVNASPLQRADVPADPVWVVHLDCDALRPTAIGKHILEEMDKPEARVKLAAFQTIFNFDPRKQLHGLTLYSAGKSSADGVLLVYADVEPDRLVTLVKAAKDHQSNAYKQHTIHNWIDDKKKSKDGVKPRVYAAVAGEHTVVFAQQEVRVAKALDVLDRNAPNLAGGSVFEQLGAGRSGSVIQAAARRIDLPDSEPTAAMLRLAKMARLEVGDTGGKVVATLSLEAEDETVAGQMASVGQGLLALMKLQRDNPGALRLAEAISLKQDGMRVAVSLALPDAEAIELMKADAARKAQKKAKKQEQ